MKKVVCLIGIALFSTAVFAGDRVSDKLLQMKFFQKTGMKVNGVEKLGELHHVRFSVSTDRGIQNGDAFVDKKMKYVILGAAFDNETGNRIVTSIERTEIEKQKKLQDEQNKQRAQRLNHSKADAAFTFGTGTKEYFIVVDPECTACLEMEKNFDKLAEHGKYYVFFFPLSFHKNARQMSLFVLNAQNPLATLQRIANNPNDEFYKELRCTNTEDTKTVCPPEKFDEINKKLQRQIDFAREIGVKGTPTVYSSDGAEIWWGEIIK